MNIKPVTLSELNQRVRKVIEENFLLDIWIVAEISEINTNASGHCYLELVEKKSDSDRIESRSRAIIWSYTWSMLEPYFESATGQSLSPGMKIMVRVQVTFHEVFGFSLTIKDIDPAFTVGEQELLRKKTIDRLVAEGVFDMNRELEIPLCPQKIAIISSSTAAGYQDFIEQLHGNEFGYDFKLSLFQSVMQGNDAKDSIIEALEEIYQQADEFEAVAIIRGGGAKLDLSSFDSYDLAYYITQFPLPIITGIGHERDDSIVDMVACKRLKTPTAVADFLISRLREFEMQTDFLASEIIDLSRTLIMDQKLKLQKLPALISHGSSQYFYRQEKLLNNISSALSKRASLFLERNVYEFEQLRRNYRKSVSNKLNLTRNNLNIYEKSVDLLTPENILKRGFSITFHNNKVLKSTDRLVEGDEITTKFYIGTAKSTIKSKRND